MNSAAYIAEAHRQKGHMTAPFIIAEAGVNHENSMDTAKRLIDEALEGGCDAIKFQSYKADTLAAKNSPSYWDTTKEATRSQHELFKRYDKFWKNEFEALKVYCDKAGIEFLSTPFDAESAEFLNPLMHTFKISSSDLTNKPFIQQIAAYGKPVLLSTGASYEYEITRAMEWINNDQNLCLMHCVLNYPTLDENANLRRISLLKQKWPHVITGYSDHTLPGDMKVLETAYLLGALIIEKHFTHDKSLPGNDHYHAMDVHDMKHFMNRMGDLNTILGGFTMDHMPSEKISRRNARRSLVAAHDIPKGKTIEAADLTWKRPAFGISPSEIDEVIGQVAAQAIQADDIMTWRLLEEDEALKG